MRLDISSWARKRVWERDWRTQRSAWEPRSQAVSSSEASTVLGLEKVKGRLRGWGGRGGERWPSDRC